MKKTFLKFVFAVTMGISLFSWKSIGANVNAEPSVSGTNISMACNETYTFAGEDTITLGENSIFKLDGRKITPIGVGEETVTVGTTTYEINVSLPSSYKQLNYVHFNFGASIDTGVVFDSNDIGFSFTYSGSLTDYSFGCDDLHDRQTLTPWNDAIRYGNPNQVSCGSGLRYAEEPKRVSVNIKNNAIKCQVGDQNFSNTLLGSIVSGYSFRFGKIQRCNKQSDVGFKGNLYDLSLSNNGVLLRNYYPAYNVSTNQAGLYDAVNNDFIVSINSASLISEVISIGYKPSLSSSIQYSSEGKLFLDKNADFTNLNGKLIIDNGTVLTGTETGASLTVGEDEINLTHIFGTMCADTPYTLKLEKGGIEEKVILYKRSMSYPVLNITGEKTLEYLSISKSRYCSGAISFEDGIDTIGATMTEICGTENFYTTACKNNYKFILDTSVSLIPNTTTNEYILIGDGYRGKEMMAEQIGYTLYQQLCKNGDAIDYTTIELVYNGVSQGLYLLTEKMRIDEQSVNITKPEMVEGISSRYVSASSYNITQQEQAVLDLGIKSYTYYNDSVVSHHGGFILEANSSSYSSVSFTTSHNQRWNFIEPLRPSLSQVRIIASLFQNAEDSLFSATGFNSLGKHYSDYYDLDSFAREFLIHAFLADQDFYYTSDYLYVDANDDGIKGKICAGPVHRLDYTYIDTSFFICDDYSGTTASGRGFRNTLMHKGDFVETISNINDDSFIELIENIVDSNNHDTPTVYDFYNNYYNLRVMNDLIWNANTASDSNSYKNGLISRVNKWKTMWSEQSTYLRGVTIENNSLGTLIANAKGALTYQWYKIDPSTKEGIEISDATLSTYTPSDLGIYYVVVTGNSLPGYGHFTEMTSNAIDYSKASFSFDMQGHGNQIASQNVVKGTLAIEPQNPYESGYLFSGWFKESGCTNAWNFETDVVTKDTIVYAKWVEGGTKFQGTSVSLCDNTWINMYTDLTDKDYQNYSFTYQIRDGEEIDLSSSMLKKIDGKWRVSIILLPYQLADVVTVRMYDLEDRLICTKADSVRAYGKRLLDNSKVQAEKDAMQALLNYGAAVQILKGYHVDDLANDFTKLP